MPFRHDTEYFGNKDLPSKPITEDEKTYCLRLLTRCNALDLVDMLGINQED